MIDEQRRELALMLGGTENARSRIQASAWFVRALLGDERVRRAIADSMAETLTPGQAQLVDLTETFHLMNARLAAGRAGRLG